jgi:anhydro-N-acetylmuramic acid kinase
MIVAGVMSGTSADGINVAIVDLQMHARKRLRHTLLGHEEYPLPPAVRRAILAMMNAESARVADLARMNFLLGDLYAEAVAATARKHRAKVDLVGCHGQTLYHQGVAQTFLGRKLAVTWQTGEGSIVAARLGVPVISDFRPADMAAGGRGAPLVPFLDYLFFRDERRGRAACNRTVLNIGGIANLTAIPAGGSIEEVTAFDTGPGNMLIDAVMERLFGKSYDRDGKKAASGSVLQPVISKLMRASFFKQKPPRTAGREEFGRHYTSDFLKLCARARPANIVATATALTAQSIADAVKRFALPQFEARGNQSRHEMIVSGGGTRNHTLITMLRAALQPMGITLHFSDEFGLPSDAKEAVAFALLAYETWNRRAGNVPSATGAKRPAILGKISYV